MNKKIFAVIKREYLTRALTKGFVIGTLIFPAMLIFLFGGVFIFESILQPSTKTLYVIDRTNKIFEPFAESFTDTLKNGEPKYIFIKKEIPESASDSTVMSELRKLILEKEIYGYINIPEDIIESRVVKYAIRNVGDFQEQRNFRYALRDIVTDLRFEKRGFDVDEIRTEMQQGWVQLESIQVTETGEVKKSGVGSFYITYILSYIIFLTILIYGQILMRSVIEEKSQRITETILSSIKPIELMLGKIVGVCMLGLTQIAIVGFFVLLIVTYAEPITAQFGWDVPAVLNIVRNINFTPTVFFALLIFFTTGFIFYSTLYAIAGAIVNSEDEGQQYQMPIIFMLIIGYLAVFSVAQNPDTTMAFWMSLLPCFTPLVMFARIVATDPLLPHGTFISLAVLILSIVAVTFLTAKIYRVGILMYGKKPSMKEIFRWLKYK